MSIHVRRGQKMAKFVCDRCNTLIVEVRYKGDITAARKDAKLTAARAGTGVIVTGSTNRDRCTACVAVTKTVTERQRIRERLAL